MILRRDTCSDVILEGQFCSACLHSLVNIWATALVTEAATELFGQAGVNLATGVMTVSYGYARVLLALVLS